MILMSKGGLTRRQMRWARLLHAGPKAVCAGISALEELGLRAWEQDEVHVLVPAGTHVTPWEHLVVHRTHVWPESELVVRDGMRMTDAARSALDAARWASLDRSAAGVVHAAIQQRLCTADDIDASLARFAKVKQKDAIRVALHDAAAGADSWSEAEAARLVVRAGLPEPRRQVVIWTPEGPRRVDLVTDLPNGRRLVLEIDGPHHAEDAVRREDALKDAAARAAGYLVLRIPASMVRDDPWAVMAALRDIARVNL